MMKKLIGNGFTNELYYFAICVIIVSAFVLGGCDSVHRTWHNIESPIHKWFDEKLDIHHDEHTVKDEPIDCTPLDAYKCFINTGLDILVLGNYIIDNKKKEKLN